jgi:8-oxo-dGTP pyrophosphatase MutT (NUDIX family)
MDLNPAGPIVTPRDAATLVLVRNASSGVEVFCVERHKKSAFMGGAIVFPGGKLDPKDRDPAWRDLCNAPREAPFAPDEETSRALAIAACRETLEEAAMLPTVGPPLLHEDLLALRAQLASGAESLLSWLARAGTKLDLGSLIPWSRWVTPTAETRRYDTRFFLAIAGETQQGAHDDHETTASFWATPRDVLARFDAGTVELMPPTHRTLSLLAGAAHAEDAALLAQSACKDPICPKLVPQKATQNETETDTLALVLPGDPEHEISTARVPGPSRFVLRGARWLPENAPRPARAG